MDWLKQIAPTIASAMGGPLVGMAVAAISKATGVDPTEVNDLISNNKLSAEQEAHRKEIEVKNTQIDQMQREIRQIENENEEILAQIKQDTEFEVMDITRKNEQNKSTVNDLSLKSKAEL